MQTLSVILLFLNIDNQMELINLIEKILKQVRSPNVKVCSSLVIRDSLIFLIRDGDF